MTGSLDAIAARLGELPVAGVPPMGRQPIHVVYGGAHLFKRDLAPKLGALARRALLSNAPDAPAFAAALGLPQARRLPEGHGAIRELAGRYAAHPQSFRYQAPDAWLIWALFDRVKAKLEAEPVEDLRIDFEDGFGFRPDAEEDHHAERAAEEAAAAHRAGTLPPFWGVRVKALAPDTAARSLRTLERFIGRLLAGPALPPGFVVTLPKVEREREVAALAEALAVLEARHGLEAGSIGVEVMVETPGALASGALRGLVAAAAGRCRAAHFGAYDYTASLEVAAPHQSLAHPACGHARQVMQLELAGSGIRLADGATVQLPIPPHRGENVTEAERLENARVVHRAWRSHKANIERALAEGFYQGWDLHPAQLPVRYAATYLFFLEALPAMAARLRNFIQQAAQATRVGDAFDDAATGQGLLNFFLRGRACGALGDDEAALAGVTPVELETRSFKQIVEARQAAGSAPA